MKLKSMFLTIFAIIAISASVKSQSEISKYVIDAYEKEGWVYFGSNTFLYKEKEKGEGNPKVLSLNIDPSNSFAMLYLFEYDCSNSRLMMLAYKQYQNKPIMEKDSYLFERKKKWVYPIKTTLGDILLTAVCERFNR